jgi:MtN3 and saliva related transmembrane protein
MISIIGIGASVFTAASTFPQLLKILNEKKANDISIPMLVLLFIGLSLWVWYGIKKTDWIIIISNTFSLVINVLLVIISIKYKKNK